MSEDETNTAFRPDDSRFDFPFYKDNQLKEEIKKSGFAVRQLLNPLQVEYLKNGFLDLLKKIENGLPPTHWTSGRLDDPVLRNLARKKIEDIVPSALLKYFEEATTTFVGGIYLAKAPSKISELSAHQDSSHTDESKYPAVYAWIPLVDTWSENGGMYVIKGSHLLGNRIRSLNVPWLYDGLQSDLIKLLEPIRVKAGEVLFFDSALVHFSSNNLTNEIRPAVNYYIKPSQASFIHYYLDNESPPGKVEVYKVDVDFFYSYDFMKRPPCPPYSFCGFEEYIYKKPSSLEDIISMLHKI